jgi:Ion transport protein
MANKSFQGLFSPLEVVSANNLMKIEQNQCRIKMSRLYYSSVFKIFYMVLIALSIIAIGLTLLEIIVKLSVLLLIEVTLTIMLVFETFFRGFMQGWKDYFKQKFNIIDSVVNFFSICLFWIGYHLGGVLGEIDSIVAIVAIIVRASFLFFRLILAIRRKKEQDVQIIDLNGISESDEVPQQTEKIMKLKKDGIIKTNKPYRDSEEDS